MTLSRRFVLAGLMAAATALSPLAAMAQGASPAAAAPKTERVQFVTSAGKFTVEVYPDAAPKTVANFMEYVKSGFYGGTIFHRVINGFMVQGGGYDRDMREKPTRAPIPLESQNGLKNKAGTVAMARTSNPNSATAQFFVMWWIIRTSTTRSRMATDMPSSARWWKAWTRSTRSRPPRPQPMAPCATCRPRRS